MRTRIVKIGNSRGLRLPKAVLAQTGLQDEVEIEVRGNTLVIRAATHPRDGWDEAFREMAALGEEQRADDEPWNTVADHSFDEEEWEWA